MRLVTSTAESFVGEADTLIMISMLQSVRDVPAVLQAAYNAIKPGGILVFSDRGARARVLPRGRGCAALTRAVRRWSCAVFDARWDAYRASGDDAKPFWDVGHPCSIKQTVLDHFLSAFEEIYATRYVKEDARRGKKGRRRVRVSSAQRDEQLYFIGRKPRASS